jgi:TM2 domain-containing membrane protein YozV
VLARIGNRSAHMLSLLVPVLLRLSFSVDCASLPDWLFNCTLPCEHDGSPCSITCPPTGFHQLACEPLVECNSTVSEKVIGVTCAPTEGKSVGTALTLSVILGWAGADRFYLGYPTIGLFKLFTGGFFGLGWYLDIFMVLLRIAKPARGGTYAFAKGANFLVRLPGRQYY